MDPGPNSRIFTKNTGTLDFMELDSVGEKQYTK